MRMQEVIDNLQILIDTNEEFSLELSIDSKSTTTQVADELEDVLNVDIE